MGPNTPSRRPRPMDKSEQQWQEQVISIDRVARVVKGGRRFRFRSLVAVGDGKNRVGVGIAKGADVQASVTKAVAVAKKQLQVLPISKGTIPHTVMAKHSGAIVLLKPAAPGTGVIAGGVVRSVLDVTGIQNILSKSLGSNNKVNNAYATLSALAQLVPQKDWVTKNGQTTASKKTDKAEPTLVSKAKSAANAPKVKASDKSAGKTLAGKSEQPK